jgi:hypothetical protein
MNEQRNRFWNINQIDGKITEDNRKDGLYMQSWNKLDCLQWGGEGFACPRNRSGFVRGTYVCMYKGWTIKSSPCTATFNDLLCFLFN